MNWKNFPTSKCYRIISNDVELTPTVRIESRNFSNIINFQTMRKFSSKICHTLKPAANFELFFKGDFGTRASRSGSINFSSVIHQYRRFLSRINKYDHRWYDTLLLSFSKIKNFVLVLLKKVNIFFTFMKEIKILRNKKKKWKISPTLKIKSGGNLESVLNFFTHPGEYILRMFSVSSVVYPLGRWWGYVPPPIPKINSKKF